MKRFSSIKKSSKCAIELNVYEEGGQMVAVNNERYLRALDSLLIPELRRNWLALKIFGFAKMEQLPIQPI